MDWSTEQSNDGGFTLIELLVVIAVIALLLSIIAPALHQAKLCAKQVVCAAKMRQWTLAEMAYCSENDDTLTPYADTQDMTAGGNAFDAKTYYHSRLSPYLTEEYYGKWGMDDARRCPMAKTGWGETAVWIGVYYGGSNPENAPFIFLNSWNGSTLTCKSKPNKINSIKNPATYLMMLDVKRDHMFNPIYWPWDADHDGDGKNDSSAGVLSGLGPYNFAQPKIHRGGCNVSLFDGHVEWIRYDTFWQIGSDGYPTHQYWYNENHP